MFISIPRIMDRSATVNHSHLYSTWLILIQQVWITLSDDNLAKLLQKKGNFLFGINLITQKGILQKLEELGNLQNYAIYPVNQIAVDLDFLHF